MDEHLPLSTTPDNSDWAAIIRQYLKHRDFPMPYPITNEYQPTFIFYGEGMLDDEPVLYAEVDEEFENAQGIIKTMMAERGEAQQHDRLYVSVSEDGKTITRIEPPTNG